MRIKFSATLVALALVVAFLLLVLRHTQLPDEQAGLSPDAGPLNALLQVLAGKRVSTDIQIDFASSVALLHHQDPYAVSQDIFARIGYPSWAVSTANPHPPTTIVTVLPFSLLDYQDALSAWSLLMVCAMIATFYLMRARLASAVPLGLAVCVTFPGAYAVGNVVPLIGLGIALAYRFRDHAILAAIGVTVAAAPKASGLILLLPFILTLRWKVVTWTAGFMALIALLPLAFYPGTWARYLDAGVYAINANSNRMDNASLLNLARKMDVPQWIAVILILALACAVAVYVKDTYWPVVWLVVALLPIAWMYSVLTLIPLFCVALRRRNPLTIGCTALAVALTVGSPPLGMWPTRVFPAVVLLALVALTQTRETGFWPTRGVVSRVSWPRNRGGTPRAHPEGAAEAASRAMRG